MPLAPTDLWAPLVFATFTLLCGVTAWAMIQMQRQHRRMMARVEAQSEPVTFEPVAAPRPRPQPSHHAPQVLVVDGANPDAAWRMEGLARIAHEWRN